MTALNLAIEKTPLERYVPPAKPSLVGLSRVELGEALAALGVPASQVKMRVQQLWHWLYVRGVTDFDAMTSVSKDLRATLAAHHTLARPEVVAEQISADGTRKAARRTKSNASISRRPTAARFACRARSAARSIAPSATPARSGSCAISPPARSSARS
jgi:23S rRNA (adenine2503-C2)-methyltransferase